MADLLAQHAGREVLGEDDAVRVSSQLGEAEAAAAEPEAVARGPGAQQQVDQAARARADPEPPEHAQPRQTLDGTTPTPRDLVDDLPLLARLAARLDDRVGQLDERRREQGQEREREVLALVHGRRREHVVGVAGGVGDVEVDRDQELESRSIAASSSAPLGTESTGLPAETNSARIWPSPGVVISFAITEAGSEPSTSGRSPTRERTLA